MFKRFAAIFAIILAAIAASASGASAQGRVIVFGDSLSDNGNLFAVVGFPPPPYSAGRFSNGPVWVEQLFGPLGQPALTGNTAGNVDLAFGGARTDTLIALPPGIPDQIAFFQAIGGDFGASDTVIVWGGANNIFQFFDNTPPAAINAGTISANSIDAATNNITSIATIAANAPATILVPNLPNIGAAPAFNTTPAGSEGAFLATEVYNQAQAAGVAQVAAANPGVNIIEMDVNAAFQVIAANPAAFGFTNITDQCLTTATCVGGTTATQNTFLFWDGVHPTEAGHALIARYAGLLLDTSAAQAATAPLGEVGVFANTQITNSVMDRMQGFIDGQYADRNGLHADIIGAFGDQERDGLSPGYDYSLYGVRGGLDKKFGTSLYGASATILMGNIDGPALDARTASFQADLYGSWSFGQMFVNADVGAGLTHISEIERQTGFPTAVTSANVNSLEVHGVLQAGYIANLGAITLMPIARISAVQSHLGDFDEAGAILAMEFDSRNTTAILGGVRLRAAMNAGSMTLFAEVGYEDYLSYNTDSVTAKLINNTAQATTVDVSGPQAPGVSVTAGVNGQLTPNIHFDAQYGLALQDGDGNVHSGKLRLKAPF